MIHIYYSFYKEDPTGQEKDRKREHRIGRELLCRGLKELYGPEVNPGEIPGDSPQDILGDIPGDRNGDIPGYMDIEQIDGLLVEGKNGKPFLMDRPDIHFNISHCGGLVVCAFADSPVGVDVESVRPVRDSLIRRVLHEEELRVLSRYGQISEKKQSKDQPERSPAFLRLFFRYWTLKESYLKQDGCGLTKEPREICFYVDPDDWESTVHLSDPGMICMQQRIIGEEESSEEYVLSVCVPNRCSAGEIVHWEEEH